MPKFPHTPRPLKASIQQSFPLTQDVKRPRSDPDDGGAVPEGRRTKKLRKRKARPGLVEQDLDLDVEGSINVAIGKMGRSLLADYIAQRTKRFQRDLSAVELDDLHIPGMDRHNGAQEVC